MSTVLTPQELSSERRWWAAMGYPGGAPELIEKHGLDRVFQESYGQNSSEYFNVNPDYAYDPVLFDELTATMKDRPHSLPMLGAPVSLPLRESAAALWIKLGVPGPLEFFVQHGLYDELKEALDGWEPQAVLEIFPEHTDGVALSGILWWHHALRDSDIVSEDKAWALRQLSPLVHQFEIESAIEADQIKSSRVKLPAL